MHTELVQARGVQGHLRLYRRGMRHCAVILGPDGIDYLLPAMDRARVVRIEHAGIMISGTEVHPGHSIKRDGPSYPQSWWCLPLVDFTPGVTAPMRQKAPPR